jgi:hypothetical protein
MRARTELPFAGYSVVTWLFDIVWDDRHCDEARLRAASRLVGPQAAYIWQNGLAPFRYWQNGLGPFRQQVSRWS